MPETNNDPTREEIATLAEKYWEEEGRPEGKAEEHWARAEEALRQHAESAESAKERSRRTRTA